VCRYISMYVLLCSMYVCRDVRYREHRIRYLSMYVFGLRVDAIHVDDRDTRTFSIVHSCIRDYSSYLSPNTRRPSGSLVSLTYFLRVDDGRRVFVISRDVRFTVFDVRTSRCTVSLPRDVRYRTMDFVSIVFAIS